MKKSSPPTASRGSSAQQPDLDWSLVRETILMLELVIAQIDIAMKDSDGSVDVLTNSFTSMFGLVKVIADTAGSLPTKGASGAAKIAIEEHCGQVSTMMQNAIVAFQFYDKLSQRLSHANHSIDALSALIADSRRLYHPAEWKGLQEKIKSKYTMEEERAMFDAIMQGKSIKQALAAFTQKMKEANPQSSDIELF